MSFVSFVSSVVNSLKCSPGLYRLLVGQDEASDEKLLDERTTAA